MFELTAENYYSLEANRHYMSCSQYDDFLDCEARAMAKIQGRWMDEDSKAFLVGNYFHSYFEGPEAHDAFCRANFEKIFKTRETKTGIVVNGKYADFEKADEMIAVAMKDPAIRELVEKPGMHEHMLTGEIFGVPWRIKLDKYMPEKRLIIDYKTCANIQETKYNPATNQRETFVETYGYLRRAAVYTEIEKQATGSEYAASFILICISKQDPPDKEVVLLNDTNRFAYEMEQIKGHLARIMEIKSGRRLPRKCGVCAYCRATKVIKRIIPYYELMSEFRPEPEEDYAAREDIPEIPQA